MPSTSPPRNAPGPPAWLADLLVDPATSQALESRADGAHLDGRVVAPNEGGVLRFVRDEDYAASFGREWNWFATTQLDRVSEGETESHATFFEKTGWSPAALDGRLILDVGCGMGRFADIASAHGARVVGVDLSRAVDAAHANLGDRPGVAIVQADVFHLPFRPGAFDLIYSLGVLHHTPDTHAAFARLPPLLKPGGTLAVWVYSGEPRERIMWAMSDLYRRLTTRLGHERLLRLCRLVEPLGRLYRTRYGRYLSPLLPVSMHPKREWRILDTFDWYAPRYQWKHRWREVEGWYRAAGLVGVRRHPFPVAVSGERTGAALYDKR